MMHRTNIDSEGLRAQKRLWRWAFQDQCIWHRARQWGVQDSVEVEVEVACMGSGGEPRLGSASARLGIWTDNDTDGLLLVMMVDSQ